MNKDIKETRTIRDQIKSLGLNDSIRIVTDLPDDPNLLSAAYSGAFWYIQPSFYEGFGFPVLEAMSCNTPVISSIGGSLKEVAGEAALLFD
ncbi:MAG: glycosyltransferase, partial [Bacteroidales bacterium]|nr:glycosyltransferase [Bacteroidales bacterium]